MKNDRDYCNSDIEGDDKICRALVLVEEKASKEICRTCHKPCLNPEGVYNGRDSVFVVCEQCGDVVFTVFVEDGEK